jgi:hypothetical protein
MFEAGRKYAAQCISAELTQSRKGTPAIELRFRTDEGTAQYDLWLTDNNWGQVFRVLNALGVVDAETFDPLNGDLSLLVGAPCTLKMAAEEFNGETRIVVKWIDPPRVPVDRERVAAYFGKREQTPPVPAGEPDDDDVPF